MQLSCWIAYVSIRGAPTSATIWGRLELTQRPLPKVAIVGPIGLVERPPSRADRAVHVRDSGVGHLADHFLSGRIHIGVRGTRGRIDELTVDQHPCLTGHRHVRTPFAVDPNVDSEPQTT
jgi:hypothetical protein